MRWVWITAGLLLLWASLAFAQDFSTGGDPWWRPLSPFGQSYGITAGNTRPTSPRPGELFLDVDGDVLELYDGAAWIPVGSTDVTANYTWTGTHEFRPPGGLRLVTDTGADNDLEIQSNAGTALWEWDGATGNFGVATAAGPNLLLNTGGSAITFFGTTRTIGTGTGSAMELTNAGVVFSVLPTPAAGAGGNLTIIDATALNAMDGAGDTINALFIEITNADHTAGTLNGLSIAALAGDAQATERAITIGTGWDQLLSYAGTPAIVQESAASQSFAFRSSGGASMQLFNNSTAAATVRTTFGSSGGLVLPLGGTLVRLAEALTAMDGGDTTTGIAVDLTNADHAGAGNTLNGISIGTITGDGDATERAISIGTGWDRDIGLSSTNGVIENVGGGIILATVVNTDLTVTSNFGVSNIWAIRSTDGWRVRQGTLLTVVGAAQNVDPDSNYVRITAAAGASVTTVTAPADSTMSQEVTFICDNSNITFNDSDAAGAANTLNLSGAATNFTCTLDDTITFVYLNSVVSGNARWMEKSRSVN